MRSGVNGTLISATPSASATALAMQAGVLIAAFRYALGAERRHHSVLAYGHPPP
jgi:hypothetical protein